MKFMGYLRCFTRIAIWFWTWETDGGTYNGMTSEKMFGTISPEGVGWHGRRGERVFGRRRVFIRHGVGNHRKFAKGTLKANQATTTTDTIDTIGVNNVGAEMTQ